MVCDELTTSPIPRAPAPLRGRRGREFGVTLSLGRREEWGKDILRFFFISHSHTLNFDWQ